MTTIDQLSTEVALQIFNHVNKDSLKNCVYVCKKWEAPATEAYYEEEINLSASQIPKIKALLEENLPNQVDHLKKLYWPKKLKIVRDEVVLLRSSLKYKGEALVKNEDTTDNTSRETLKSRCKFEPQEFLVFCLNYQTYLNLISRTAKIIMCI
jgi:hypothetical protein